jgi:hypothetical protein
MTLEPQVPGIATVIQLAIAPVFMLTAIGSMLNVIVGRLSRAIDRARLLESDVPRLSGEAQQYAKEELHVISRRVRWVNRAITSCTVCALLICLEIAALFVGAFLTADVTAAAGWIFVLAMVALTVGLLAFLREVFLSTRHVRIGSHRPGF